ncbi:spore germination protein GerPE [Bacillaceae bacterium IKA-2]|nr:spore germination protein GerPE [Bacillaceae bacterium IKA-2]
MPKRISMVNHTIVRNVSLSSIFLIGDASKVTPRSRVLAVQRRVQIFFGKEGDFEAFPIFTMEIPKPKMVTNLTTNRYNLSSFIKVDHIHVTSVSASSLYQIGSNNYIAAESRIKHIRQLDNDTN